jgi:hypothetical protein
MRAQVLFKAGGYLLAPGAWTKDDRCDGASAWTAWGTAGI